MTAPLSRLVGWVRRRAENTVVLLLALMFAAFCVQIVFRYVFNWPVGWTSELSVICWTYMVLIGSALWLRPGEEISFDLLSARAGPRARRTIGVLVGVATVALFALSLPATLRYVAFMKVESSAYLKIRLDVLYAVYVLFVVAVVVRFAWSTWRSLRGDPVDEVAMEEKGYGL